MRATDTMQPDLHNGGGFIHATRVARMVATAGMQAISHLSGGGSDSLDLAGSEWDLHRRHWPRRWW